MLRQTSDWEGTLWGKPDWADRPEPMRRMGHPAAPHPRHRLQIQRKGERDGARRAQRVAAPAAAGAQRDHHGSDRRLRHLALVRLREFLRRARRGVVQSVSGGGHWGGGMFINAYDMGRFGYLTFRRGKWGDRELISDQWVDWALTPTPAQPNYGFMNWYLNTNSNCCRARRRPPSSISATAPT